MKKLEQIIGILVLTAIVLLGGLFLSQMIFFRLLIGLAFGYTLSRAFTGFAGSVNRAYRAGSAKLMRAMMVMFFLTSLLVAGFLFTKGETVYGLWINPINLGLLLGGILFGFGMSLSSCCATGVMTDIVTGLPRAAITLLFFGIGVFIGFPIQTTASWVTTSLFGSNPDAYKGVFLPDWFKWDGLDGYLGAIILTGIFATIVVAITYAFEKKRKANNAYTPVDTETLQEESNLPEKTENMTVHQRLIYNLLEKPWTLKQGGIILSILFAVLFGVTKSGWGASTPYGMWFGKLLMLFGVPVSSLTEFTGKAESTFTFKFFEHGVSVQNLGIILGTLLFLLTAGIFKKLFTSELKITFRQVIIFALGGLTMGFGTRLSNGCNVGALYTPIAEFSLSGWIYLVFLVLGGILGNILFKRIGCKRKQ